MKLVNKKPIVVAVLLIIGAIIPVIIKSNFILHLVIITLFYAFISSSWNIIGGLGGQISIGHSAFAGIGAYTSTLLFITFNISPWIGMFVGGVFAAIVSIIIGLPTFRLRGVYYSLATIAFAETIRLFIIATEKIGPFNIKAATGLVVPLKMGFSNFLFLSKVPYYYIIFSFLVIVIFVTFFLKKSKLGYYLVAVKENQIAASALGINHTKQKIIAAAISAFFTAVGGTFFAQYVLMVDPFTIMGINLSIMMVIMPIVGGINSVVGPLMGAVIMIPISELANAYLGGKFVGSHLVLYGIAIVVIILYIPGGIAGLFDSIRGKRMQKMTKKQNEQEGGYEH